MCPPQGRLRAVRTPGFLVNGHSPHGGPTPAQATGTRCWILPLSLPWSGFPFLYNVWPSQRKAEVSWPGPPIQPPREAAQGGSRLAVRMLLPPSPACPPLALVPVTGAGDAGQVFVACWACPSFLPHPLDPILGQAGSTGQQQGPKPQGDQTGAVFTHLLQDAVGERLCFQQQQIDETPLHEPNSERACVRKARVPSRPHTDLSRRRHHVPERKSTHKEDNSS